MTSGAEGSRWASAGNFPSLTSLAKAGASLACWASALPPMPASAAAPANPLRTARRPALVCAELDESDFIRSPEE
jgi:hypothetical protein